MGTYGIVKGFDMLEHRYLGLIDVLMIRKFVPFIEKVPVTKNCLVKAFRVVPSKPSTDIMVPYRANS